MSLLTGGHTNQQLCLLLPSSIFFLVQTMGVMAIIVLAMEVMAMRVLAMWIMAIRV